MTSASSKEALKALRQQRKAAIGRAKQTIKDQNKMIKAIKAQIRSEGKTVPQIAAAIGRPTDQVLLFVATLRKYGQVAEVDKEGDYFTYRLAEAG